MDVLALPISKPDGESRASPLEMPLTETARFVSAIHFAVCRHEHRFVRRTAFRALVGTAARATASKPLIAAR